MINEKITKEIKDIDFRIEREKKDNETKLKEENKKDTDKDTVLAIFFLILTAFLEIIILYTIWQIITNKYNELLEELKNQNEEEIAEKKENDKNAFTSAKKENLIRSYNRYLENYPQGFFVNDAIEEIAWLDANMKNDLKSFQIFMEEYSDGHYAKSASEKIRELLIFEEENKSVILEKEKERQKFHSLIALMDVLYKKYARGKSFSESKAQELFAEHMDKKEIKEFFETLKVLNIVKGKGRGQTITMTKEEALKLIKSK